jgi:hypothetical protein
MNVPASLSPEANLRDNLSVDLYWDARRETSATIRESASAPTCGVRRANPLRNGLNLQPAVELDSNGVGDRQT